MNHITNWSYVGKILQIKQKAADILQNHNYLTWMPVGNYKGYLGDISMKKIQTILLATATVVAMAGCSGGKSGGGSSTTAGPVTVTSANAQTLAGSVFTNNISGTLSSASAGTGLNLPFATSGAITKNGQQQAKPSNIKVVKMLEAIVNSKVSGASQPLQDVSSSLCTGGGSADITTTGLSSSTPPISGTVSVTFSSCVTSSGTLNGGFSGNITVSANNDTTLSISYNNFSVTVSGQPSVSINGDFYASDTTDSTTSIETIVLTSNSLTVSSGSQYSSISNYNATIAYNSNTGGQTSSLNGIFDDSLLGGAITVSTTTPFVIDPTINTSAPSQGVMVITGAGGSKVRITAQSDGVNVLIEVDANGDGTYETSSTVTWASLESGGSSSGGSGGSSSGGTLTNEGSLSSPVAITSGYNGQVAASGDSYYSFATTPGTSYTVTMTGLASDIDLYVFYDSGFSSLACQSTNGGTLDETCTFTATGSTSYIDTYGFSGESTFTLTIN